MSLNEITGNPEVFNIATQLYVKLRRVSGRVMDVSYFTQNQDYARHIIELTLATQDHELHSYAERLCTLMDIDRVAMTANQKYKAEQTQAAKLSSPLKDTVNTPENRQYIGLMGYMD